MILGLYSHLFFVEKVTGSWTSHRSLSFEHVCSADQVQYGDSSFDTIFHKESNFVASLNCAYFQVLIHHALKKYCHFILFVVVCQFHALCLSPTPQVYFNVFMLVSARAHSRRHSFSLLPRQLTVARPDPFLSVSPQRSTFPVCLNLGIVQSSEKLILNPGRKQKYLGAVIDVMEERVFLAHLWLSRFKEGSVLFLDLSHLLGQLLQWVHSHMASLERLVLYGC